MGPLGPSERGPEGHRGERSDGAGCPTGVLNGTIGGGGSEVFRPGHMQLLETPAVPSEGSLSRKRREEKRASERPELQSIKKAFRKYSESIRIIYCGFA